VTSQRIRIALVALAVLPLAGPARADDRSQVAKGRDLYVARCVSCHGSEAQGVSPTGPPVGAGDVRGAGPPLRGVGALAADFYLRTGYMPLRDPYDQPRRQTPAFGDDGIRALVEYIGSFGGPGIPQPHPQRGSSSEGLKLFTENCAGCHQVVAEGGMVTGAIAPPLQSSSAREIAEAVRIGPYLMPRFSRQQLSDAELDSIIRYVEYTKDPDDRGGWGLGHLGPIPEGLVAWLLAGAALVLAATVIGRRHA
jgi:ubiquinol-cytochrome c reductase cytochrome c subunit